VTFPDGYTVRPCRPEDAAAVAEVMNAAEEADAGIRDVGPDEVESIWLRIDPAEAARVVEAADGTVIAYVDVTPEPSTIHVDGYVHPAARGRGIGAALLRAGEELAARQRAGELVLHTTVVGGSERSERLVRQHGYRYIRSWFRMHAQLETRPPAPEWPERIAVRQYVRDRDEGAMHETLQDAFQDHWGHEPRPLEDFLRAHGRDKLLAPEASFFAETDGEIAGAVLSKWRYGEGWIQALGVRPPWRRHGLGLALLRQAFGALYELGARGVGLSVEADSPTGATRLYERAGMRVQVRWDTYEKRVAA
jgi:mycothiol synthase